MDERLEIAPCGFIEFDDDGTVTYANTTLATLLGWPKAELIGRKFESILTVANRIFYQTHFFPLLKMQGHAEEIFLILRARNGTPVPVVTSAVRQNGAGRAANQCAFLTVQERRKYEDEIVAARRKAEEALRNNAQLEAANAAIRLHLAALDRRLHEVENKNRELQLVGQILSHDLREPMRKVKLFADLVQETSGNRLDREALSALHKIYSESDRAIALIVSIQRFLTADAPEALEKLDLNRSLETAAGRVRDGFADWTLEREHLPTIDGRRAALQLLFEELLDNAVKFRSPTRPLQVKISARVVQLNSYHATKDQYSYRDYAQIEVADNGIGFDPKYRTYVFGLLKKVELASPGFGVGLAICRKIAEAHYGSIEVDPKRDSGTTVTVRLPLTATEP